MAGIMRMTRLVLLLSAILTLGFAISGCKKKPAAAPPPEMIYITATTTNLPIFEEWIGTLDGFVNAQIRAQVTGYLLRQNYAEGSRVKKNELLFEIDPRTFKAILDQAESKLAQDKAVQAKTELDVKRYTPLVKEEALSQETLDNAIQANLAAKAQVQADEATAESARLNLGFTKITSPIDGIAGTALAQIGDLLSQSGPVLTTVSTVDPIKVYFQANEHSYLTFWREHAADPDNTNILSLNLILSDGSTYPHKGKFFYADRQINPTTGTIQIVGLFPNPDYMLRPGQYGLVRAETTFKTNTIVLPQRAVIQSQGAYQVAVIGGDNKIQLKTVKVGRQISGNWVIDSGIQAGDHVVVEGTLKAKDGAMVVPREMAAPPASGSTTNAQH